MSLLTDRKWKAKYKSGRDNLLRDFYEPALAAATRYDRATGFFSAGVLMLASRGVEGLVRNQGHWRLIVGCQLAVPEVEAIERGLNPAEAVALALREIPLSPESEPEKEALELLSWLVARGSLEVKFAIPCDDRRRPLANAGMFHEKSGIIEDKTGERLAFNGSINETVYGWHVNVESFHVFTSWSGVEALAHVDSEEQSFRELWNNEATHCLVVDLPDAARDDLLRFLPAEDATPRRLTETDTEGRVKPSQTAKLPDQTAATDEPRDLRPLVWGLIQHGATFANGGERVGEATSTVSPWPHQVRAFDRMHRTWPPRLLIADEVGLGKTIEAGLILRQAWLDGRLKRALILAPKAVLRQWQIELREKFNLDWPIYDGDYLEWTSSRGREEDVTRRRAGKDWHQEPFVITSSHLMRRAARAPELIERAEPWDLVVLDEAHHARRKGGGLTNDRQPNRLLDLMQRLRGRSDGLLLLTATPMQVHPKEVWDLLALLQMPEEWTDDGFVRFFEGTAHPNPSPELFEELARLFRAAEAAYGPLTEADVLKWAPNGSRLAARKILGALRDSAQTERRRLETDRRKAALRMMQEASPVARLISRHTRDLLRRYYRAGRISTPVPDRKVRDEFVELTPAERAVYDRVEDYISNTYNAADPENRNAIGFVMTIYRRRLASSFQALRMTLEGRLEALKRPGRLTEVADEDVPEEDDVDGELAEVEYLDGTLTVANEFEEPALIASLLEDIRALPPDTKVEWLLTQLRQLRDEGRQQAMVFTQFTDTLDYVRGRLAGAGFRVLCFSGRGGEAMTPGGQWTPVSREESKRRFAAGAADILMCTDAAAEGLNFQFCGALVNYDMPWNPMRVEQRIGRIDRLGQKFTDIRIVNLHYDNTVETDVYRALRQRIRLFEQFVGRLQPILAALPRAIAKATLAGPKERDEERQAAQAVIGDQVQKAEASTFDLDALTAGELDDPTRFEPVYDLDFLDAVIRRPDLLPPGVEVRPLGPREYEYSQPGMAEPLRVTTSASYYDQHPESVALWSPGSPLFPAFEGAAGREEVEQNRAVVKSVTGASSGGN
ncbi:MAG: helicase [Acidobacteria bacterium SCN 69-37]|nr:MAG: helicase [Acidobacteria bacterium SCN 69-37]